MWLFNPIAGHVVDVLDEVHVKRILSEGGYEVASPVAVAKPVEAVKVVVEQVVKPAQSKQRKPIVSKARKG